PATESDEVIKSSVEDLVPINSLLEETNTFHNSLSEFKNFCFDLREISSGSTTTHSNISLPDYEAFYFDDDHIKEISSGSTTTHSDISLSEYDSFIFNFAHEEFVNELTHIISPSEYDCFYFRNLPDSGELMSVLNSGILTPTEPIDSLSMGDEHLDTILATESDEFIKSCVENLVSNPKSMPNHDSSITISSKIDSLFDEFAGELTLLKSISSGIDETDCQPEKEIRLAKRLLYDNSFPRPMEEIEKSPDLLSHQGLEAFQPSAECPMIINGKNIPLLDVPLFYFYPLDQFKYEGN
nr:hypothetical protein [Tanacetum cinerariifolium]